MEKSTKVIIAVIAILIIVAIIIAIVTKNQKPETLLDPINSPEDLSALIDKVYEGEENVLPTVATQIIDVTDTDTIKMATGLENGDNLEYVVTSEPMISSQAYSFVLAKVKTNVNANEIAKEMSEKINTRKWICVSAEKLYVTSSGDVVCLVMASEELAKPIYEKFKTLAGTIGEEYEKTEEEPNMDGIEIPGMDAVMVLP